MWGYARVSSSNQNPDRQLNALFDFGIDFRNIRVDEESGKDFNRRAFMSLVGTEETAPIMREGDCLVVQSIDRLGRNYEEIRKWWAYIINDLQCNIVVLDMPLLDTRENGNNNLDRRFMCDLILQILSYVAEKERENIRTRQRQGIDLCLSHGKPYGRPKIPVPDNFSIIAKQWKNGEITAVKAMKTLGISRSVFYRLIKEKAIKKEAKVL